MPVLKKLDNLPFTAVSNEVVKSLSAESLGCLVKMLMFPPNFEFSVSMLMKILGMGRDRLRNITNELKEANVLRIQPIRGQEAGQFFGWEWVVSTLPMESDQITDLPTSGRTDVRATRDSGDPSFLLKETLKKKESINNKKDLISSGTRLPNDWSPTKEQIDWARSNAPKVDLNLEAFKFLEYWTNKTGKAAEKIDWNLTWQVWIRSANARLSTGRAYQPRKTTAEKTREAFERSIAKEEERIARESQNAERRDNEF